MGYVAHREKLSPESVRDEGARGRMIIPENMQPSYPWWRRENWVKCAAVAEGFRYTSDNTARWLTNRELQELVAMALPAESVPASSA